MRPVTFGNRNEDHIASHQNRDSRAGGDQELDRADTEPGASQELKERRSFSPNGNVPAIGALDAVRACFGSGCVAGSGMFARSRGDRLNEQVHDGPLPEFQSKAVQPVRGCLHQVQSRNQDHLFYIV